MLTVARIRPEQWQLLRQVRLAALQDAPYAFGSTYADTVTRPDAWWQEMADKRATSPNDCTFFVFADGVPVGLAGGYRYGDQPETAYLVSVWVAPSHRGTDAARLVVGAVCNWAASVSATVLLADVTEGNERALSFYRREGFHDTGKRSPYPNDATKQEILLARSLIGGMSAT